MSQGPGNKGTEDFLLISFNLFGTCEMTGDGGDLMRWTLVPLEAGLI